jgi:hypothetical protein
VVPHAEGLPRLPHVLNAFNAVALDLLDVLNDLVHIWVLGNTVKQGLSRTAIDNALLEEGGLSVVCVLEVIKDLLQVSFFQLEQLSDPCSLLIVHITMRLLLVPCRYFQ